MPVRVSKPAFNLREKINELDYAQVPIQKMPGGTVLQVQSYTRIDEPTYSSTHTPTAILQLHMQPKRANSKFLIQAHVAYSHGDTGNDHADSEDIYLFCYRNEIAIGYNSTYQRYYNSSYQNHVAWMKTDVPFHGTSTTHDWNYIAWQDSLTHLDEPGLSEQRIEEGMKLYYSIRFQSQNSFYLNRCKATDSGGSHSSLTVTEIAGDIV